MGDSTGSSLLKKNKGRGREKKGKPIGSRGEDGRRSGGAAEKNENFVKS